MNTSTKTKVLYVITKSAPFGGAQKYVYDLATHLPEQFEAVTALGGAGPLKTKLEDAGVRTIPINAFQRDLNVMLELQSLFELVRVFKNERPDVVHLNSSKAGGLGALAARLAGVPHIVFTAHGWGFREDRGSFIRAAIWTASLATALLVHRVIAVSERDRLHSPLRYKTTTIQNGIAPLPLYTKAEARKELHVHLHTTVPHGHLWVGTVAELHKNKGLHHLIEAATQVPEASFFVIGEGEERARLQNLIRARGLGKRAHLLGEVPDAAALLRAFDIFALPSIKEGFPYTIIEAGYAALPVVASAVGGIPEIIVYGKTGIPTQPKSVLSIAHALRTLAGDKAKRTALGKNLRELVTRRHTLEQMVAHTVRHYQCR